MMQQGVKIQIQISSEFEAKNKNIWAYESRAKMGPFRENKGPYKIRG